MGGWKADGLVWGWVRYQRCYPIVKRAVKIIIYLEKWHFVILTNPESTVS